MTIDLNFLVAFVGCSALLAFWFAHLKSGVRGFLLVCVGWAVIFLGYKSDGRFISLAGILVACVVLALVLLSISMLAQARQRRVPRYQAPREIDGTCSTCAKSTRLKYYQQGWLCVRCARRAGAKVA